MNQLNENGHSTKGIHIKHEVLQRVVSDNLDSLLQGDFYRRIHLGAESYDPILNEVKNFSLDNEDCSLSLLAVGQPLQQQTQSQLFSEELESFIQIVAASIMIDACTTGENAEEFNQRSIKKKKMLLVKTLKGPKFLDFRKAVLLFDQRIRGDEMRSTIEPVSSLDFDTKEEFERHRDKVLSQVSEYAKSRFRDGGFVQSGGNMLPVLEIGPFDVEPGPVCDKWIDMYNDTQRRGVEMTRLIYWYGVKYEDRCNAYSFIHADKIITYEEGKKMGYCKIPKKIIKKINDNMQLTKTEEQIVRGLEEIIEDMKLKKCDRIRWMMTFYEGWELPDGEGGEEESVLPELNHKKVTSKPNEEETETALEGVIKRKPGKQGRSKQDVEEIKAELLLPIKRKPGRSRKVDGERVEMARVEKQMIPKRTEKTQKSNTFVSIDEDQEVDEEAVDVNHNMCCDGDESDYENIGDTDESDDLDCSEIGLNKDIGYCCGHSDYDWEHVVNWRALEMIEEGKEDSSMPESAQQAKCQDSMNRNAFTCCQHCWMGYYNSSGLFTAYLKSQGIQKIRCYGQNCFLVGDIDWTATLFKVDSLIISSITDHKIMSELTSTFQDDLPSPTPAALQLNAIDGNDESVYVESNLNITMIKEDLKVGDEVYACWLEGGKNNWFPGKIMSFDIVNRTMYGVVKTYSIVFDDGDRDDKVEEMFVWGKENYLLETSMSPKTWRGVYSRKDPKSCDEYAETRGWYMTELSGNYKFPNLRDAMEAYDQLYVRRRGKMADPKEMNFPAQWGFLPGSIPISSTSLIISHQRKRKRCATHSAQSRQKNASTANLSTPAEVFDLAWYVALLEIDDGPCEIDLCKLTTMASGVVKDALETFRHGNAHCSLFEPGCVVKNEQMLDLFQKYKLSIINLLQMRIKNGGIDECFNMSKREQRLYDGLNEIEKELGWLMEESKYIGVEKSYDWNYITDHANHELANNIDMTKRMVKYYCDPLYYISVNSKKRFNCYCEAVAQALSQGFRRRKTMHKLPPIIHNFHAYGQKR